MEPIGSTNGSTSSPSPSGVDALRSLPGRQPGQGAASGEVSSASAARKQQDSVVGKQLGVQRSAASGGQEFKAYGPESPQRADAPPGGPPPPRPGSGDATTPVADKKQEDPQVQQQVAQLKSIEVKVKAHEAAHKAAGGAMTGSISYTYTRGPDGKNYVTGGEVPITVSPGKTPQETISRMQQVIQAALAPADPSPQDRAVAGQATQQLQKAQQERSSAAASDTTDTSGSTGSAATDSKSAGQTSGDLSGTPVADSAAAGQRRSQRETGGNSAVAQAARAYSDPTVTGTGYPSRDLPVPSGLQSQADSFLTGFSPQDARKAASAVSPSMITGFGSSPQLSRYA